MSRRWKLLSAMSNPIHKISSTVISTSRCYSINIFINYKTTIIILKLILATLLSTEQFCVIRPVYYAMISV